jgi:hypothetical protein
MYLFSTFVKLRLDADIAFSPYLRVQPDDEDRAPYANFAHHIAAFASRNKLSVSVGDFVNHHLVDGISTTAHPLQFSNLRDW